MIEKDIQRLVADNIKKPGSLKVDLNAGVKQTTEDVILTAHEEPRIGSLQRPPSRAFSLAEELANSLVKSAELALKEARENLEKSREQAQQIMRELDTRSAAIVKVAEENVQKAQQQADHIRNEVLAIDDKLSSLSTRLELLGKSTITSFNEFASSNAKGNAG